MRRGDNTAGDAVCVHQPGNCRCSLHASREELVLSFTPALGTKKVRWTKSTIRKALRGGLDRAAHDTAGNGIFGDALAFVFREAIADPIAFFLGEAAT